MHNIYEIIFVIEPTVSIDDLKVHLDQFLDIVKKKMVQI
jgi:ribosomal protein S6